MRQGLLFKWEGEHVMKIHIIDNTNNFSKLRDNVWECGFWKLQEDKAKKLVGGHIYFHKTRLEPSFFGGTILGYRIQDAGPEQGRIIFEFQYSSAHREIRTDRIGWSVGMKIVQQ